jgi:hypothetical protein
MAILVHGCKPPALIDGAIKATVIVVRGRRFNTQVQLLRALLERRQRPWGELRAALGCTPQELGCVLDQAATEQEIMIATRK